MTAPLTSVTGDSGSNGVGLLFNTELQWIFRKLNESDFGIDAQIEPVLGGHPSGRVMAVQIKAGPSWFAEVTPAKDGWVFRENTLRLRDYWLNYADPVLLVLYKPATHIAYWQHITTDTAVVTGKGFKVEVPASQRVDASSYRALAKLARQAPPDGLTELLRDLPAGCGNWLLACDETDPALARSLANTLVDGRGDPERVVTAVTDGWGQEQQQAAWLAVGEYAIAYGATRTGGDCFLAADRAGDGQPGSGRLRAFAGAMLAGTDPDRARDLLTDCMSVTDSRLLAAVGLAALDHGANLGPIPVPAEVLDDPEGAAREPTVQRFLADQRMRVGDWEAAITYHEQALARASNSPSQQVALADALLKRASSTSATLAGSDYRRAAGLAETARAELRRWRGDSVPAAHLLMQIKIMAADEASAFRVALAQPDGEATAEEAASPQLALGAARIAYGHGDIARGDTFAAVVDASGDPVWRTNLAANRANAVGASLADREAAWREVLAVDQYLGRRVAACAQLAGLGCWPLTALDDINDADLLSPGIHDVLHAYALTASGDEAAAMVLLRRLRDSSLPAAEEYAQRLEALGRVDDAVQACEDASNRFGYARLELLALDVLTRAGRNAEFLTKATELLGRSDLPYRLRHAIRAKMIDEYTGRHEWARCERLAQDGLQEITNLQSDLNLGRADALMAPLSAVDDLAELHRRYAWMIIINQFNQGQYHRAYQTLDELHPDAQSAVEVTTWFDLYQLQDWTADRAEAALQLAERPGQPIDLVRRILFTLRRSMPTGDDPALEDVRERLEQAWQARADQREPPLVPISADQYAALMHANSARTAPALQGVWQGTAPVGAISAATGRPYLLSLAQQAAGFLPAVDADTEVYRREVEAATVALGNPVVVETTALFVAAGVLNRWSLIAPEFSNLLIAAPALYDILLSQVHARALAQDAVTISLAPDEDLPHVEPLADDIRRQVLALCRAVGDAVQSCRAISTSTSANVDEGNPLGAAGPWWTGVAVAAARTLPLYSDDVVVRARARAQGVPAFGTLALLEALAKAHRLERSKTNDVLSSLFEHSVVDLPHASALVTAAHEQAPLAETVLLTLARPATWTALDDQGTGLVITLANHPEIQADPRNLASLVYACASGWAAAFSPPEVVIAKLLTVILVYGAGVTADAARTVVPAAQKIASAYEADFMPHLQTFLLGVLTDPTDQFHMTTGDATQTVRDALSDYE
ncbi:hypothetical protein Aple_059490 [Acrocarpospora pleiomorpha]|uniref:DUF4365 domain-containing protein n=1 Tax=Acrocarpospora pleiomorpha TaxID=90975 RepID=A0A5M3XQD4_9ACTN|nr:DUF4365 domain-containing protein [Acrocarpospora pleiomorpha]GES23050.1 hypothetical protein Aple_059490 [Acrocarpospora pleiomorpha]